MIDQHLDPQAALELPRFFDRRLGGRAGAAVPPPRSQLARRFSIEDGFSPRS